jgi:hypothetical protein
MAHVTGFTAATKSLPSRIQCGTIIISGGGGNGSWQAEIGSKRMKEQKAE